MTVKYLNVVDEDGKEEKGENAYDNKYGKRNFGFSFAHRSIHVWIGGANS